MTKEEYIREVQRLEAEKCALDEEYRRSMPVQPHQVVVIDGKEYWLERYRIISYALVPTFYEYVKGKIKRDWGLAYPDNWRKMKPKEA